MNPLSLFFRSAFADQLAVAGQTLTLCAHGAAPIVTRGILTETNGSLQVEVAEHIHTITAHVLLPADLSPPPAPGNLVRCAARTYLIVGVTRSPEDAAFSCDLSTP